MVSSLLALLITGVELAFLIAGVFAVVDALRHSAPAFEVLGRGSRTAWIVGLIASVFVLFGFRSIMFEIAAIVAISVYLVEIRHQLASIEPRR
ncbi:MAG: DUF2516 family protein [Candidatus Nanopelagicales bacterium]